MRESEQAAMRFNDMITAADADGLAELMTEAHSFVDSAENLVAGRAACREAWRGFFAAFPSYRNEVTSVDEHDGTVIMTGRSLCTETPELR